MKYLQAEKCVPVPTSWNNGRWIANGAPANTSFPAYHPYWVPEIPG
jgi:hypothetical protein